MRAGEFDRIIEIQSRRDTINAVGQPTPTWSTFAKHVPAAYEPMRGREYFEAQGMQVVDPARFRIRYKRGVVAEMRVIFDGKIWDVAAVVPMGRNVEHHLYCATGLTEG